MEYVETKYGKIDRSELNSSIIPDYPKVELSINPYELYEPKIDDISTQILLRINKKGYPIKDIKDYKTGDYFYCQGSPHKITIPQFLTPKLAYLVGYIYGDGGFKDVNKSFKQTNKFEHKIIIADEFKEQIEKISYLLDEVFNLKTKIRKPKDTSKKYFYINPTCKVVYRFLTKTFELPSGPKSDKIRLPKIIKESNHEMIVWFIRGIMDADGDTRAMEMERSRLPSPRVKIRLCTKDMIEDLQKVLNNELNLNFTGPYSDNNKNYYIQTGKNGTILCQKLEIFNHPIKKWRLNRLVQLMGT